MLCMQAQLNLLLTQKRLEFSFLSSIMSMEWKFRFLLCILNFLEQYDSIIVHSFIYTCACRPTCSTILVYITNILFIKKPFALSIEFFAQKNNTVYPNSTAIGDGSFYAFWVDGISVAEFRHIPLEPSNSEFLQCFFYSTNYL